MFSTDLEHSIMQMLITFLQRRRQSLSSAFSSLEFDIIDGGRLDKTVHQGHCRKPTIHASLFHPAVLQHDFQTNWYISHIYRMFFLYICTMQEASFLEVK